MERHFRFGVSAKMGKFAMHNSIEMKETLRFLQDLSLNNNKQWFDANRDRYLAARATVDALAVELIDGIRFLRVADNIFSDTSLISLYIWPKRRVPPLCRWYRVRNIL